MFLPANSRNIIGKENQLQDSCIFSLLHIRVDSCFLFLDILLYTRNASLVLRITYYFFLSLRIIALFEGSQASPFCPCDRGDIQAMTNVEHSWNNTERFCRQKDSEEIFVAVPLYTPQIPHGLNLFALAEKSPDNILSHITALKCQVYLNRIHKCSPYLTENLAI